MTGAEGSLDSVWGAAGIGAASLEGAFWAGADALVNVASAESVVSRSERSS
jgi:hypothetical protein